VKIVRWKYYAGSSVFQLRTEVIGSIKRLIKAGEGWSVAVLVPTKRMMAQVSDALNDSSLRIPSIRHSVWIDPEGPTLAARLIACLMEPAGSSAKTLDRLIEYMSAFYRGRGGSDPNTTDLRESASLQKALESLRSTGKPRAKSILGPIIDALEGLAAIVPTGDPEEDWLAVRRHPREQRRKTSADPRRVGKTPVRQVSNANTAYCANGIWCSGCEYRVILARGPEAAR
jgi:ATP-dependent DNA helicase UvrD/PcrA